MTHVSGDVRVDAVAEQETHHTLVTHLGGDPERTGAVHPPHVGLEKGTHSSG